MPTACSSAGVFLNALAAEGWHYTVSYNKWTGPTGTQGRGTAGQRVGAERGGNSTPFSGTSPKGGAPRSCMRWRGGGMACLTGWASLRVTSASTIRRAGV